MREPNSFTRSFVNAGAGVWTALKSERNLRVHVTVALLVTAAGWLFFIPVWQWMVIIVAFGLVMALELVNTSVEALVDLASPEVHPLAKRAKDTAAGAVLVAAGAALGLGLTIFLPYLHHFGHDFMIRWHQSARVTTAAMTGLIIGLGLLWGVVPRQARRRPEPFR